MRNRESQKLLKSCLSTHCSYQDVFTLYAQLVHNFSRAYGFRLLEGSQAPGCQNVFYITVWIVHPCSPMRELTTLVSLYSLLLVYTVVHLRGHDTSTAVFCVEFTRSGHTSHVSSSHVTVAHHTGAYFTLRH